MGEAVERYEDKSALGHLATFWRVARALRRQSPDERQQLLERLAVSTETRVAIVEILDRLRDPLAEPGAFVDGPACELGWQPSVLAPIFYGNSDLGPAEGLPGRVRLFYPSVDGSPQDAKILAGCGRYPLVAFLHGQCLQENRYRLWDLHPIQLARSGYVVVVPELSNLPPFERSNPEISHVLQVLTWMRTSWPHAAALMPPPMTAIVGHSWGALLGGYVASILAAQGSCSAYASLSGGWQEWPSQPPRPLSSLNMAAMFMWGTGFSDLFSNLEGAAASIWHETPGTTHKVVFRDGEHWDYLPKGASNCENWRGPCLLMRSLAADFLTTFLSHYMPPEKWSLLNVTIPHNLIPPPLDLTPRQEFFAGGHLQGFAQIGSAAGCSVTHTWRLPPFGGGSISLP